MASLKDIWWVLVLSSAVACAAEKDEEAISDASITAKVQSVLAEHSDLGTQIYVHTVKGTVYLSGIVITGYNKDSAERLAMTVNGVKRIVDNIGISK